MNVSSVYCCFSVSTARVHIPYIHHSYYTTDNNNDENPKSTNLLITSIIFSLKASFRLPSALFSYIVIIINNRKWQKPTDPLLVELNKSSEWKMILKCSIYVVFELKLKLCVYYMVWFNVGCQSSDRSGLKLNRIYMYFLLERNIHIIYYMYISYISYTIVQHVRICHSPNTSIDSPIHTHKYTARNELFSSNRRIKHKRRIERTASTETRTKDEKKKMRIKAIVSFLLKANGHTAYTLHSTLHTIYRKRSVSCMKNTKKNHKNSVVWCVLILPFLLCAYGSSTTSRSL